MKKPIRILLLLLAALFIAAPLSILLTILLSSFWTWFEATTGIESIGHSGPAEWCYLVIFLLLFAAIILALLFYQRSKERK